VSFYHGTLKVLGKEMIAKNPVSDAQSPFYLPARGERFETIPTRAIQSLCWLLLAFVGIVQIVHVGYKRIALWRDGNTAVELSERLLSTTVSLPRLFPSILW